MARLSAREFRYQDRAHKMPPMNTTIRGPNLSTNQPSTGTSQVSNSTKMVKATWMEARPHWCFSFMGSTNSVHPY